MTTSGARDVVLVATLCWQTKLYTAITVNNKTWENKISVITVYFKDKQITHVANSKCCKVKEISETLI